VRDVGFAEAEARLTTEAALDRRTSLDVEASALVSSGTDADARDVFPLSRVAHGVATLERSATRNDELSLAATAFASRTDGAGDVGVLGLDVAWTRRLSQALEGRLGAGVAADQVDVPDDARGPLRGVAPTALLGLQHTSPRGHAAAFTLRAITAVDRYGGRSYRAVELRATARRLVARRFLLNAAATVLRSVPEDEVLFGGLELSADWSVREGLSFEAGVRGRWQEDRASPQPSFLEVTSFLALRFDAAIRRRPPVDAGPG
jgi:hypothetical protein